MTERGSSRLLVNEAREGSDVRSWVTSEGLMYVRFRGSGRSFGDGSRDETAAAAKGDRRERWFLDVFEIEKSVAKWIV
jgi:hypothetical protein